MNTQRRVSETGFKIVLLAIVGAFGFMLIVFSVCLEVQRFRFERKQELQPFVDRVEAAVVESKRLAAFTWEGDAKRYRSTQKTVTPFLDEYLKRP